MRRAATTRFLAAGLLVLAGSFAPSFAAEEPKPDPAVEELLSKLEQPPPRAAVRRIVGMGAVRSDRTTAMRVVGVLWHSGGHASTDGLLLLAKHDDPQVKATAMRGVAHVGLRMKEGFAVVRDAMRDGDKRVREAAFEAVGRVGDADDVPALLDATQSKELPTRHAAFRSLTALTGQKIPWDTSRWSAWWDEAQETLPARIDAALDVLEAAETKADREDARITLARYGWMALPLLSDVTRAWLRSTDVRLRTEGFRLADTLRLGDLAEDVSSAFRYERHPDAWPTGRLAAVNLGTPTAGIVAPRVFVPDQKNDR